MNGTSWKVTFPEVPVWLQAAWSKTINDSTLTPLTLTPGSAGVCDPQAFLYIQGVSGVGQGVTECWQLHAN